MNHIELSFEYNYGMQTIYDWWTDLSGKGYVGQSLKSIERVGEEDGKILVRTKWVMMGFPMHLIEKLTLEPPDHWIWEPEMMGIHIIDDFRLEDKAGKVVLSIRSEMKSRGMMGKLASFMLGRFLKRVMVQEWVAANRAFGAEISLEGNVERK